MGTSVLSTEDAGRQVWTSPLRKECQTYVPLNSAPETNVKRSPTLERKVPVLIPVLGSQPAGDVSHIPGGRLPLLSARPAVTPTTLKRAATNFAPW